MNIVYIYVSTKTEILQIHLHKTIFYKRSSFYLTLLMNALHLRPLQLFEG